MGRSRKMSPPIALTARVWLSGIFHRLGAGQPVANVIRGDRLARLAARLGGVRHFDREAADRGRADADLRCTATPGSTGLARSELPQP